LPSYKTKEGFIMTSLSTPRTGGKNPFSVIADPFLHDPGLPFASVLDAASIQRVFREEKALFEEFRGRHTYFAKGIPGTPYLFRGRIEYAVPDIRVPDIRCKEKGQSPGPGCRETGRRQVLSF
jgi:hypothetical protein